MSSLLSILKLKINLNFHKKSPGLFSESFLFSFLMQFHSSKMNYNDIVSELLAIVGGLHSKADDSNAKELLQKSDWKRPCNCKYLLS